MNRTSLLALASAFTFAAGMTSAYAENPYDSLLKAIGQNTPRGLCLAKSDGCPVENSAQLKAIKAAIDDEGAPAVIVYTIYEQSLAKKAIKLLKITNQYQQEKIRKAAEANVAATLAAYQASFSPNRLREVLAQLSAFIDSSTHSFAAFEAEAKQVTTGRESYLRGRHADFAAFTRSLSQIMEKLGAMAGVDAKLKELLNSLPIDPRLVFEGGCGGHFDGMIFAEASVDLIAEYDFIARLTNARNLTMACKDTTDAILGIGESNRAKYSKKNHTLTFYLGDTGGGNFNSKSVYDYTSFRRAYEELKKTY